MFIRKLVASLIIAGVLSFQLVALASAKFSTGWYWPFMAYPMYSMPHYRGEVFVQHRIVGVPCAGGEQPREIGHADLGLKRFAYYDQLRRVAGPQSAARQDPSRLDGEVSAAARRELSLLMSHQLAEPYCRAQLWERSAVLGEPLPADPPWKLLLEWNPAAHVGAGSST